ncbi:MAG: T9SS type A sorting domain-containing protein [Candidatus Cloacimonetes bacterium]|nr:T9SS type A sorting domain-containing protein [Candidatus Cloacimonadota bacterium]
MKKMFMIVLFLTILAILSAELEIDIPFDLDIIGDDFSVFGDYTYESDWITITNIGQTTEIYTLEYSNMNLPVGWSMSLCNDLGACYMPNFPVEFTLESEESLQIHIIINVTSTGGYLFDLTFDNGDLSQPINYTFTFNTKDSVSANDDLVVLSVLKQNYPNPFNPSTTISYEITPEEAPCASISIYNLKGQLLKTFLDLELTGSIVWNGKDESDNIVNSGVYFFKLESNKNSQVRKMVLIK